MEDVVSILEQRCVTIRKAIKELRAQSNEKCGCLWNIKYGDDVLSSPKKMSFEDLDSLMKGLFSRCELWQIIEHIDKMIERHREELEFLEGVKQKYEKKDTGEKSPQVRRIEDRVREIFLSMKDNKGHKIPSETLLHKAEQIACQLIRCPLIEFPKSQTHITMSYLNKYCSSLIIEVYIDQICCYVKKCGRGSENEENYKELSFDDIEILNSTIRKFMYLTD